MLILHSKSIQIYKIHSKFKIDCNFLQISMKYSTESIYRIYLKHYFSRYFFIVCILFFFFSFNSEWGLYRTAYQIKFISTGKTSLLLLKLPSFIIKLDLVSNVVTLRSLDFRQYTRV